MFPNRGPEPNRSALPRIAHDGDYARSEPHDARSMRALPHSADAARDERRPATATERRLTPPSGSLGRPPREMAAPQAGSFGHPNDEAYAAQAARVTRNPAHHPCLLTATQNAPRPPRTKALGVRSIALTHALRKKMRTARTCHQHRIHPETTCDHRHGSVHWKNCTDPVCLVHRWQCARIPLEARTTGVRPCRCAPRCPSPRTHARGRAMGGELGSRPMHPYEHGGRLRIRALSPPTPAAHGRWTSRRSTTAVFAGAARLARPAWSTQTTMLRDTHPHMHDRTARDRTALPTRGARVWPGPGAMRPNMMHGMEPPRPASSLGVMNRGGMPGDVPGPASAVAATAGPAAASSVNANRRVAHLLSEQKRRESINTGFEDLRQAIPACRDGQDSKATILKRALEYIRELESVVERQHRGPLEAHALGGYSNRSPPDDKDHLRRFGRPGGDEERRASGSARHMSGASSSNSGEATNGPRIGGMPSNAFNGAPNGFGPAHGPAPYGARPYAQHESPNLAAAPTRNGAAHESGEARNSAAKRWAEDSDEDQRSPSRRRVSDGDKDEVERSPIANTTPSRITAAGHRRWGARRAWRSCATGTRGSTTSRSSTRLCVCSRATSERPAKKNGHFLSSYFPLRQRLNTRCRSRSRLTLCTMFLL